MGKQMGKYLMVQLFMLILALTRKQMKMALFNFFCFNDLLFRTTVEPLFTMWKKMLGQKMKEIGKRVENEKQISWRDNNQYMRCVFRFPITWKEMSATRIVDMKG
ncbi:hypothetical protein Hdeb2414_s0981g00970751 [Helianthus debilis subsp. tardiflorus]